MLGLVPAAAWFLCLAGQFEAYGLVTAETRAGQAPLLAGLPPTASVVGVVTPTATLWYLSPSLDVKFDSGLRLLWRKPNYLGLERPLVLDVSELSLVGHPSRTSTITATAAASVGEPDYSELARILGANQASLPVGVSKVLSLTTGMRADLDLSRTLRVGSALGFTYRRPFGDPPALPTLWVRTSSGAFPPFVDPTQQVATTFPREATLYASPFVTNRISRLTDVTFTTGVAYTSLSTGVEVLAIAPEVGFRRHMSREVDLRLAAGISYADFLTIPTSTTLPVAGAPATPQTGSSVAPVGDGDLTIRVFAKHDMALRSETQVRVEYYVDPVLAIAGPRGTAITGWTLTVAPDWTFGLNGSFSTSLSAHPLPSTPPLDETIASASVPVRHRLSEYLVAEGGFRWADASPHWAVSNGGFHQRQLWVYLALTATSRKVTPWTVVAPDTGTVSTEPPTRR